MKGTLFLAAVSFAVFSCADGGTNTGTTDSTSSTNKTVGTEPLPSSDSGTGVSTGEGTTTSGTSTGSSSSHTTDTTGNRKNSGKDSTP